MILTIFKGRADFISVLLIDKRILLDVKDHQICLVTQKA